MTDAQRAARLRMAIELLEQADAWIQQALEDTDAAMDLHHGVVSLIEDILEVENV